MSTKKDVCMFYYSDYIKPKNGHYIQTSSMLHYHDQIIKIYILNFTILLYMKYCSFCGKKQIDDNKPFINVFLNGNTSDNRKNNMIIGCVNCTREYKFKRYEKGVKTLIALGYKCNKKGNWVYNNKLTRIDTIDLDALNYQISFLQKENKELKKLIKMNSSK